LAQHDFLPSADMLVLAQGEEKMPSRRVLWMLLLGGLAVLLVGLGFGLRGPLAFADIATAYAAKQTCSCRMVSGRSMDSCLLDFPEDARGQITVIEDGPNFRASAIFGTFKADAVYEDGFGCRVVTD
jgi:hypothetical protein